MVPRRIGRRPLSIVKPMKAIAKEQIKTARLDAKPYKKVARLSYCYITRHLKDQIP